MIELLGTQRHERAIGEQELKRRKLEQKALEKQHECDHQRELHEFRMMQMRVMLAQRATGATQPEAQPSFEGFGLLADLNDPELPPAHLFPSTSTPF